MWWVSAGKKHCSWWCAICGEKSERRAPNRLLVVQTGENASQAKVFKVHAVPQGACENLINALKLLANQQKDGDSSIQSIVTGLCERSRKGIMDGLRNIIEVDNRSAPEVGHLKEGTRPFEVRRPELEEGCPEVSIREGPGELTLRTEEVGSKKACINVDHIVENRSGPPLVDTDWHAFCLATYKGVEGRDWEDFF